MAAKTWGLPRRLHSPGRSPRDLGPDGGQSARRLQGLIHNPARCGEIPTGFLVPIAWKGRSESTPDPLAWRGFDLDRGQGPLLASVAIFKAAKRALFTNSAAIPKSMRMIADPNGCE